MIRLCMGTYASNHFQSSITASAFLTIVMKEVTCLLSSGLLLSSRSATELTQEYNKVINQMCSHFTKNKFTVHTHVPCDDPD